MDKLTAIKIKYDDGTYSDEIPVSVLSENVDWNSTLSLVDILGQVDTSESIQDQINNLKNTRATNNAISSEAATRASADSILQSQIDQIIASSGEAQIAAVNAEATARQSADATLQNNIDAEATARQSADNTLQGNINSEASARQAADSNLQSQINQLSEAPNPILTPQMFGAKADGITNDTLAVQMAINQAGTKKGSVYFPDGVYVVDDLHINEFISIYGVRATLKASSKCVNVLNINVPWLGKDRTNHGNNAFVQININCNNTAESGIYSTQMNAFTVKDTSIRDFTKYGIYSADIAAETIIHDCYFRGSSINGSDTIGIYAGEDSRISNIFMKDCHIGIKAKKGGIIINNYTAWLQNNINDSIFLDLTDCTGSIKCSNLYIDTYEKGIVKNTGSNLFVTNIGGLTSSEFYDKNTHPNPIVLYNSSEDFEYSFYYSSIINMSINGMVDYHTKLSNDDNLFCTIISMYNNNVDSPQTLNRTKLQIPGVEEEKNNSYIEYGRADKMGHIHIEASGTFKNHIIFQLPYGRTGESEMFFPICFSSQGIYGIPDIPARLYINGNNLAEIKFDTSAGNERVGALVGDIFYKL